MKEIEVIIFLIAPNPINEKYLSLANEIYFVSAINCFCKIAPYSMTNLLLDSRILLLYQPINRNFQNICNMVMGTELFSYH